VPVAQGGNQRIVVLARSFGLDPKRGDSRRELGSSGVNTSMSGNVRTFSTNRSRRRAALAGVPMAS